MKAFVLEELNSPLGWRDLELTPLSIGQVKVKILASGICGAQLQEIRGHKGNAKFLPHLMGHEGCGIVEEVGQGVTKAKVGDKVVMHWRVSTGIEADFPKYVLDGKTISSGKVTTLSEYSIVSENRLTTIPQDTPNEFAALLGCCITTAFGVINNDAQLRIGEKVAVLGCGGLGLSLIWGSKIVGASSIIGYDISEVKGAWAKNVGGTEFVNIVTVGEFPVGNKADVVIDTTGVPEVISKGIEMLSDHGRLIMIAQPEPGKSVEIPNASAFFGPNGKSIVSTQGGGTKPGEDIPRYIEMYGSGKLKYEDLISETIQPSEVNAAIERLKSGLVARVMVDFTK
jgi:Zn-dependent alcohol dehydrogenase